MTHLQNQQLLQGLWKFQFLSMLKSFVFQLKNMVLMKNLRSFQQGGLSMIVHTLQRNGKRTSASIVKHGPNMTWKGNGSKLQLRSMKHINEVSRSGKLESKPQSSAIHLCHVVHLQREFRRCVHFLMFMTHFVRMIQRWLHIHSQSSKAPPSLGRPKPSTFYSDAEPPRIGAPAQPPPPAASRPAEAQGLNLPLAATPMTPSHHLILQLKHFQSILLWRRARVPSSIHLSLQQHRVLRANMFGQRRFHILLRLQSKSLWQHLQQLICLSRASHVQKALQQIICQHLQRLCPCRQALLEMIEALA